MSYFLKCEHGTNPTEFQSEEWGMILNIVEPVAKRSQWYMHWNLKKDRDCPACTDIRWYQIKFHGKNKKGL